MPKYSGFIIGFDLQDMQMAEILLLNRAGGNLIFYSNVLHGKKSLAINQKFPCWQLAQRYFSNQNLVTSEGR